MKTKHSSWVVVSLAFLLITIITACNFPLFRSPRDSSFDQTRLMMITSRGLLDLYESPQETGSNQSQILPVTYLVEESQLSTKDDLNQHLALQAQYQKLLDAAIRDGNQHFIDVYRQKVEYQKAEAERLEARRAEWRRRHRFFPSIVRGARNFGRFVGRVVEFIARTAADYIQTEFENYVNQIRAILRNPIRYVFDLSLNQKLDIIRSQFTSRLGPILGPRIYDALKIDQAAWKVERRIFNRPPRATKTPRPTRTPKEQDSTSVNITGNWHGRTCREAEATYQYRWSVDLIQDPATKMITGTVKFHDCPGGGRVLFRVTGEPQKGPNYILNGTLMEGAGELYSDVSQYSSSIITFTFNSKKGTITPNYAP